MWSTTGGLVEIHIVHVTDDGKVQARGQMNADGTFQDFGTQDLRLFEPYGLHGRPYAKTAAVVAEMQSDDLAIVGYQPASRPTLSQDGQIRLTDYSSNRLDLIPGTGAQLTCIGSKLGASSAAEAHVLGTQMLVDLNIFLSAATGWSALLNTLKTAAADAAVRTYASAMEGYVNTLIASATSWISNRHYLDQ